MAIHMSRIDELALITLDRPEALNALSFALLHDLSRQLDSIASSDTRALLVTGALLNEGAAHQFLDEPHPR